MEFKNFSEVQEKQIEEILGNYKNFFSLIDLDVSLNNEDTSFKVFGKYNTKTRVLKLNPKVFTAKDFESNKNKMSMLQYVIFHEIAHNKWKQLTEEEKQGWYEISNWQLNPTIKEGFVNLAIPQGNKKVISNWYYDQNAEGSFPRWYSRRNPKDDFADCWVFVKEGLDDRLEGNIGKQKIKFVKRYM